MATKINEINKFTVGKESFISKIIEIINIKMISNNHMGVNHIPLLANMHVRLFWWKNCTWHTFASRFPAVLIIKLPGPGTILLNQHIPFLATLFPNNTVTVHVIVKEWEPIE